MDCSRVIGKLSSYVDEALDEQTLEAVEAHLATCSECREELASLRLLVTAAGEIEPVGPPYDLKQRIFESVRQARMEDRRCAKVAGLVSAYVDGELSANQEELVEAHVGYCEHCAEELRAVKMLVGAAGTVSPVEPPADLKSRIAAAIAGEPARESFVRTLVGRLGEALQPRFARLAYAGAAAGLAAIAIMSILPGPARQPIIAIKRSSVARPRIASAATSPGQSPVAKVMAAAPERAVAPSTVERPARHRTRGHVVMASAGGVNSTQAAKPKARVKRVEPIMASANAEPEAAAADEPKTVEVATAPPAPEVKPETKRPDQPALAKVAAAPLIAAEKAAEMMKQIKAEAAMRRSESRTASVPLFTSRF